MADEDKDDTADRKRHVAKMMDDPERGVMLFTMFMAAAMAGGDKAGAAAKSADQAIQEVRRRFT